MAKSLFVAVAVLMPMIPGLSADPVNWGPTVDGVRMSVAIIGNGTDADLQITVQNVGDRPLLLPVGTAYGIGDSEYILRFRAFVKTSDANDRTVVFGSKRINGDFQFSPLAIQLIPNASYALATPLVKWHALDGSEGLKALRPSQLKVELDTTEAECSNPCSPSTILPCWRGKLLSNILQMPN
jgi:hypothetical protein